MLQQHVNTDTKGSKTRLTVISITIGCLNRVHTETKRAIENTECLNDTY